MTRVTFRAGVVASLLGLWASPGFALTINPYFDSSVTTLANATQVEQSFNAATSAFSSMFNNPVTVNINVSWGSVAGQALPYNALGASSNKLYGYFSYGTMKSWLQSSATTSTDRSAYASLPTSDPLSTGNFVLTSAQAKGLKLLGPSTAADGSIGFGGSSTSSYDFNRADGISSGQYDFVGVVQHEVSELLGRISGLSSATPSFATAYDLFRFSAPGQRSFNFSGSAYFSTDNGNTDLGDFNNSPTGGDRADWLSTYSTTDAADAFTLSGKQNTFSTTDQAALDVLGWGSTGAGAGYSTLVTAPGANSSFAEVPEPASLALLGVGLMGVLAARRRVR